MKVGDKVVYVSHVMFKDGLLEEYVYSSGIITEISILHNNKYIIIDGNKKVKMYQISSYEDSLEKAQNIESFKVGTQYNYDILKEIYINLQKELEKLDSIKYKR